MNGWVVIILHDGPIRLEVYGPYADQHSAELASAVVPRRGVRYSVYVTELLAATQ